MSQLDLGSGTQKEEQQGFHGKKTLKLICRKRLGGGTGSSGLQYCTRESIWVEYKTNYIVTGWNSTETFLM